LITKVKHSMQKKIVFVSHCILNTASKVVTASHNTAEDQTRHDFLHYAIDHDIQLIQLPCPEFTLYGASRWGHVMEQFNNPFFRDHCRHILTPIIQQMKGYLQPEESSKFKVLGIIGINGSPSCGVSFTCSGPWGGEFSRRTDLTEILSQVTCISKKGILMDVLSEMMEEEHICLKMIGLDPRDSQPLYDLLEEKQ